MLYVILLLMSTNKDLDTKIIEAIERISRAQKILLWDKAKLYGLTPLQTQILMFIEESKPENANITNLSLELGVSQPTISDSVKSLINKGLIEATVWEKNRHFKILKLTDKGKEILKKLENWNYYLKKPLMDMNEEEKVRVFDFLLKYVIALRNDKTLYFVKACPLCRYFLEKNPNEYYCKLFNMDLKIKDLRINCPDFEEAIAVVK